MIETNDLHGRLMAAMVRCARAQEESCSLIGQHLVLDDSVRATLAAVRRERAERARAATFAIGQARVRKDSPSG